MAISFPPNPTDGQVYTPPPPAPSYIWNAARGAWLIAGSGVVVITGGTIDGTTIGGTTPSSGRFTTLTASSTLSANNNLFAVGSDGNGQLSLGSKSTATTPFMDWFSTGTTSSGFRMISTGSGNLTFQANASTNVGSFSATGLTLPKQLALNVTQTWSGSTASPALTSQITSSGSTSSASPYFYTINYTDTLDAAASGHTTGLKVTHNYGGGTTTGGRTAADIALVQQGGANTDSADNYYVGLNCTAFARYTQPGSSSTAPKGRIFGFNASGFAQSGFTATNLYEVCAAEFDVAINTGSSAAVRAGIAVVDIGGTSQGYWSDNQIWLYGAGQPWRYSLCWGDSQPWCLDSTQGTMLGARMGAANSAATPFATRWGIDFSQVTFPATGNAYDGGFLRSNGLSIDGAGTIQQGPCYSQITASGKSIDCKGAYGTGATIAAAGSGYQTGRFAVTTPYGGVFAVTASGGAATAVSQLVPPVYPTTSPPANPVATTSQATASGGSGLTLNLTWNTTATTLALQPSGGATTVGGSLTAPTLTVNTSISGAGFAAYLASPPAIGGTAPAAGSFTSVSHTAGATFGSQTGASSSDLSKHITLHASGYGFCVTSARLNLNCPSNQNIYFVNGSTDAGFVSNTGLNACVIGATTPAAVSATQVNVGTSAGPNIRSGTGAATGTQPAGSLFLRTDGASGTRLYVSAGGGTWAAVAGV